MYLAQGGKLTGALCISDPPRKEAKEAVRMLKECGIDNVIMLTGDSVKAANIIAEELGITTVHAQVLPEDKHSYVEELKANGKHVIMVGDGIPSSLVSYCRDRGLSVLKSKSKSISDGSYIEEYNAFYDQL